MMTSVASLPNDRYPHIDRMRSLATLAPAEVAALELTASRAKTASPRREILQESSRVREPVIILAGWAARVRYFKDGRRQILHLLLPGDLIDFCQYRDAVAPTTIVALTDVHLAPAPVAEGADSGLAQAYLLSNAIERACLFRQIARLGRLDAYDRLADLLTELGERLQPTGLATGESFHLPLTQEMIADCLGLTSVHVNRMLKQMRREGVISIQGNVVRLIQADQLRSGVNYQSLRVAG